MDIFDAAQRYRSANQTVIILAGKEYGQGSSRDWAAKGPWILVSVAKAMWLCNFTLHTGNSKDIHFNALCVST